MLAHAHCRHAYALSEHATIQHSAFSVQYQYVSSMRIMPIPAREHRATDQRQRRSEHNGQRRTYSMQPTHAPIIPHNDHHPVPPPHAQVQQPPRESLYVSIELAEIPRKVRRIVEVAPARPAVCPGGLLARDERGPRGVRGQDVVPEVGGEGLADERGVRWACDLGEREWGAWAWARP